MFHQLFTTLVSSTLIVSSILQPHAVKFHRHTNCTLYEHFVVRLSLGHMLNYPTHPVHDALRRQSPGVHYKNVDPPSPPVHAASQQRVRVVVPPCMYPYPCSPTNQCTPNQTKMLSTKHSKICR
uniref:Secreted protein n=1 Tax=Ixodes ricinus TaxID=34613 RepID=A0A6B0UP13_IXORI